MTKVTCRSSLVLLLVGALAQGCSISIGGEGFGFSSFHDSREWVEESEELQIPAADVDALACLSHNGAISVRSSGATESIQLKIHRRAGGEDRADAEAAMRALALRQETSERTYKVYTEWAVQRRTHWNAVVSYDVTVPERFHVDLESHNGEITVEGIRGTCQVLSHNGDLRVEHLGATAEASTHNGQVRYKGTASNLELTSHNGEIIAEVTGRGSLAGRLESHNGAIFVDVNPEVSCHINCSTNNGSMHCDVSNARCHIERRRMTVDLGEASTTLHCETHNGAVTVR